MQVQLQVNDKVTVVAEGKNHTEVFSELVTLVDAFSVSECGVCKSKDIVPIKRVVEGVNFYEWQCRNSKCRAKLSMGQHKEGQTLFKRNKYHKQHPDVMSKKVKFDKDKSTYLPDNGWSVYKPENAPNPEDD